MNSIPKISGVMSVYNGEKYLKEAIDSILNQTFKDFEFIIVNDGSTDKSLEIIQSYNDERIKIIDQKNTGLAKALNNGIKIAQGKYIARMDADDISMPNRLKIQYNFMEEHPGCAAVGSNAEVIDMDGNYVLTSNLTLDWNLIKNNLPATPFFHSSTMYKKNSFKEVGGYPEIYRIEDVVFFNKLAKIGELLNIPDVLIKYRLVPTAITTKSSKTDSKIIEKITLDAVNNKINSEQINILKSLTLNKSSEDKLAIYHYHLAKKYLWNNYQPKLARKNLIKSIKIRFNILSVFFYLLSFFPKEVIIRFYKSIKQQSR